MCVHRQWYMNVCLCHSETIRQFCPVNETSSDSVLSTSWLRLFKCNVYMFGPMCVCVWHQWSLCKWLIQVFDFKANGDSSGGWAGGKMLHLPPSSLGLCSDLHFLVWYFFFISYDLLLIHLFPLDKVFHFCIYFCHWFCLFISSEKKKKNAFHIPKCLELFLRRVCHSNVMLRVQLGGSGLGPLPTFVLLTQLHGLSATILAWGSGLWMTPGIRSPSSDLWTSWPTRSGWPHCDSACSDSGLRVPCLCRCVLSSMARFSPACLPPCFLPCRSVQWQGSWQCFGSRLRDTYQLQLHWFTDSASLRFDQKLP